MINQDPVPQSIRDSGYTGCHEHKGESRDIPLGADMLQDVVIDWNRGSGNENMYNQLRVEHQGNTMSCVSMAISKFLEYLNIFDMLKVVDLSARFIYSKIYLPSGGGAYIKDGIKIATKYGDCEERLMKSYMPDGTPPTEQFIRGGLEGKKQEVKDNAYIYKAQQQYAWITDGRDFDLLARVIKKYKGFVSGFNGHCLLFLDFGQDEKGRYIKYINSYGVEFGDKGFGKYYESNPYPLYNAVSLVDAPSHLIDKTKMLARLLYNGEQYIKKDNMISRIPDVDTLNFLVEFGIVPTDMQEVVSLEGLDIKRNFPSVNVDDKNKELLIVLEDAYRSNQEETGVDKKEIPASVYEAFKSYYNYIKNLFIK